ncbi:MAG: putative CRISPR-associated protein [Chloroherpetonaceae bacterium]|nr:putative CRISPR-associated protein [Chloroherpetonaceae bacterium]MCS7211304.1 putative CRISPR-associated protein [Chloroherpetonaceae bacterium]MDW8466909.1 putative CRISPR-associated protein [Chloroherpetonaceae bacterium]
MTEHHIVTVGISLLTNYEREHKTTRDETIKRHHQLIDFMERDPVRASAELNSLNSKTQFLELKDIKEHFGVSLIYTDTIEGKFATNMLRTFLERKGFAPIEVKLKNIALPKTPETREEMKEAQRLANEGLKELQEKVTEHVEKLRNNMPALRIYFNVTGGYKAQVAVLYGLGKKLSIPVYYMHEEYKVAIELP